MRMRCCPIETHVRIISVICLILTGISGLNIITLIFTGYVGYLFRIFFDNDYSLEILAQMFVFMGHSIAYIMSFIASFKRNKLLLIPFLIVTTLQIMFLIGIGIYVLYLASIGMQTLIEITGNNDLAALGMFLVLIFLVPIVVSLPVCIYFLVVVTIFYSEIVTQSETNIPPPTIIIVQPTPNCNKPQHDFNEARGVAIISDTSFIPSAPKEPVSLENVENGPSSTTNEEKFIESVMI